MLPCPTLVHFYTNVTFTLCARTTWLDSVFFTSTHSERVRVHGPSQRDSDQREREEHRGAGSGAGGERGSQ